jgi:hypothetical protein
MRVSLGPSTWTPDVVVVREKWITRAEFSGVILLGVGILALALGGDYHPCAEGLCRGASSWQSGLSIFVAMLVIYALLARDQFFPFCRQLTTEVRHRLTNFKRAR